MEAWVSIKRIEKFMTLQELNAEDYYARIPEGSIISKVSTMILVRIRGTNHKIALLQSLITCSPLPPFQCCLHQTPLDHLNIELLGGGGLEGPKRKFCVDILEDIMKTPKFASVPAYFDEDCRLLP